MKSIIIYFRRKFFDNVQKFENINSQYLNILKK